MDRRRFLLGAGALALLGREARAQYQPQGRELTGRLVIAQAEDGALLLPGSGPERVCDPYAANQAVCGLLLGVPPRYRSDAAMVGQKWIRWYCAHANPNGTIDEHRGPEDALKPAGRAANTDATAATFLAVVAAHYDQTGDDRTIIGAWDRITKVAEAILITLQKNGLTYARRDEPVAYLVNNAEVWAGFDAFSKLCNRIRKKDEGKEYAAQAEALLAAIDNWLWQQKEGLYGWALRSNGKLEAGLDKWSPQWVAQLAAIALLPEDERRNDLRTRLMTKFPYFGEQAPVANPFGRRPEPLPAKIENAKDLEMTVWWGRVAATRHDQAALERYQLALSRAPWSKLKDLDLALIGNTLRVGGARTPSSTPLLDGFN